MSDEPEKVVMSAESEQPKKRWGYMMAGQFRPLPRVPLELAGHTQPPFYVELPDGRVRYVIEEPEQEQKEAT